MSLVISSASNLIDVFYPKDPYGYVMGLADPNNVPTNATTVDPRGVLRPTFDAASQTWTSAPESEKPVAEPTLAEQVATLAYQQMITQKTITDLQTQNAQMAYQLMTTQGGTTA